MAQARPRGVRVHGVACPKPAKRKSKREPWNQAAVPKVSRIKDADHVRAVRGLPCCACAGQGLKQRTRTEAHHTRTRGAFGGDDSVAPLCTRCHKLWHLLGRKSFKARTGVDVAVVARDLWRLRVKLGSIE